MTVSPRPDRAPDTDELDPRRWDTCADCGAVVAAKWRRCKPCYIKHRGFAQEAEHVPGSDRDCVADPGTPSTSSGTERESGVYPCPGAKRRPDMGTCSPASTQTLAQLVTERLVIDEHEEEVT